LAIEVPLITADYLDVNETVSLEDKIYELETRLEETKSELRDLATMGTLIASILDIETILSVVMEMSIRAVEGEVGVIQLAENGELVSKITWGVDDTIIKSIIYRDDHDISSYCYEKQIPIVWNGYTRRLDYGPTINSIMALPIKSRARCHGTIVIVNKTNGNDFSDEDKDNLEILVNYAAVAIDNSMLLTESLQKQKIEQELAIARQIQETILPDQEIKIKGVEIGTIYCPARDVGGDYYDILKVNDSSFLMIIGDVSNKGIPAAMVMSATAGIIRAGIADNPNLCPSQLMSNLNNVLCDGIIKSHGMFVTLFIARFDLNEKKARFCNAGHLPPLFWDADQQQVVELKTGGTFVGQFPGHKYSEGEIEINNGDRLFAFTDGLTEATDMNNNLLGLARVKQIFLAEKELPTKQFCIRVKEWVDRYTEGADEDTIDDFTLLEIRILPEGV
jgi:sigma-B regulation protein RsbU (phosphoserine phosphatase)